MADLKLIPQAEESTPATFEHFWLLWPKERRVEKKAARDQWSKLSEEDRIAALISLVDWRKYWAKEDPTFIPHPHRWLRGQRWEDELPVQNTVSSASHVPASLPESSPRTQMPDSVKQLIAKLKGR